MGIPFPSLALYWGALCCWVFRGNGLAFCHGLEKLSSCSRLPDLRFLQTWGSTARSPQGNEPFTLWAVKGMEQQSKTLKKAT